MAQTPIINFEQDLANIAIAFQRDFFVCSEEQMIERWLKDDTARQILPFIYPALEGVMVDLAKDQFKDHNPFWEFTRKFTYHGRDFDDETRQMVTLADYYLDPGLQKEILCRRIYDYIRGSKKDRVGLAIFITRFGTKTFVGCIGLTLWLLTLHRIFYDDYITIRIIHDLEDEAVNRASIVKNKLQRCAPLRELYPEMRLPDPWMKENAYDLEGCKDSGAGALDKQVTATGARSAQQGRHPRVTIIDDIESERHADSPAAVKETRNFFRGFSFSERVGASTKILLGTFYNPDSVHATIVENSERAERDPTVDKSATWEIIRLPAIIDEGEETERILYPLRLPKEVIEQKRQECILETGNDLNWRMQMMLDFKASNIYRYAMDQWHLLDLERPETELEDQVVTALDHAPIFTFGDFAGKDELSRGRGDWNAIWVEGFPVVNGRVVRVFLDAWYDNTSTITEIARKQLEMAAAYDAWWVIAEESPSHRMVGNELNRVSAELGLPYYMRLDPKSQKSEGNIRTVRPVGGKGSGVANLSAWKASKMSKLQNHFNNGLVYFNSAIDEGILDVMHTQIQAYPFIKKDDLLDAGSLSEADAIVGLIPTPRVAKNRKRRAPREYQTIIGRTGLTYKY